MKLQAAKRASPVVVSLIVSQIQFAWVSQMLNVTVGPSGKEASGLDGRHEAAGAGRLTLQQSSANTVEDIPTTAATVMAMDTRSFLIGIIPLWHSVDVRSTHKSIRSRRPHGKTGSSRTMKSGTPVPSSRPRGGL